jgi:hypothetical protein
MPDSLILKRAPASWSRRHRWTLQPLGDRLGTLEELTEDQARTIWESYLAHVPLGVRADFSSS